ncbi:MAG: flagellar type III secretion system pore protein FliP [Bryobacteraceae bacterium]|nr:flagellar type III secretion system pore protein FliP [Bryobacteraceae bacterium]
MRLLGIFLIAAAPPAVADTFLGVSFGGGSGGQLSSPIQVLVLLTALTLLPAVLMSVTPFLRLIIVLHFLRQALGTQTTPSNQVLVGLALFLTLLVLQPLLGEIQAVSWDPLQRGESTPGQAWERAAPLLKNHLLRHAREKDLAMLVEISRLPRPNNASALGFDVLVPAYILGELRAGFQIGAVLFLPFLIIDLVAASVTLAVGMVQLPPVMIAAPFKILLFVLADGWNLVVGSLVRSFTA